MEQALNIKEEKRYFGSFNREKNIQIEEKKKKELHEYSNLLIKKMSACPLVHFNLTFFLNVVIILSLTLVRDKTDKGCPNIVELMTKQLCTWDTPCIPTPHHNPRSATFRQKMMAMIDD